MNSSEIVRAIRRKRNKLEHRGLMRLKGKIQKKPKQVVLFPPHIYHLFRTNDTVDRRFVNVVLSNKRISLEIFFRKPEHNIMPFGHRHFSLFNFEDLI